MGMQEFNYLLQGLVWTLYLTAMGFGGGIAFGILVALMRVSRFVWLRSLAIVWISIFQGTPLLMQLFVFYFGLPLLGVDVPAWAAVAVALTAHASAFLGEIWRGAIQAVPHGQIEAANAVGLHAWSRMCDIIAPQALKLSLPATVGFLVQLLKGTSLASIVGFIELTRAGYFMSNNQSSKPLLVFGVVGLLYFAMCWPLSLLGSKLERQLAVGSVR